MVDLDKACGCTQCEISALSDQDLLVLCDAVGEHLGIEIAKASDRQEAIARKIARDATALWLADFELALEVELEQLPPEDVDPGEVGLLVDGVGRRLDPVGSGVVEAVATGVASAILVARRSTRRLVSSAGRPVRGVSQSLTTRDIDSASRLSSMQNFWIGDYWTRHLGRRISSTVARESLQRGLGRSEVGNIVRGVVSGDFPGVQVPGTFRGTPAQYFEGLAGTVRTHGSTMGALHSMADAGVETYEYNAVLDQRTSEECSFLHGRRFRVSAGLSMEDRMLRTGEPDDLERTVGWRNVEDIRRVAGSGSREEQSRALETAGVPWPPRHFRCRSVLIPS